MKTLSATSYVPSATAAGEAEQPPPSERGALDASPQESRGVFHGQEWTFRGEFDRVLQNVPLAVWQDPRGQGWQRIKENARREVWRAPIGDAVYYVKYYGGGNWTDRLRGFFRQPACEAEWQGGLYALRAGIAAVVPAGYTSNLRRDGRECSLLVTEAVEPAYPLSDFWRQILADTDATRLRRDVAQMIELLGEMIARAHQAGFEHLDMHAANILVTPVAPGRYRSLFVDLQSARRGVPISDRAVVRNLAQLNQWFRRHSSVADRLRFLRAYLRWRNEYETVFAFGRPLKFSFKRLVTALARAADRHAQRLWAQRDRRACRGGRYFTRLRLRGGWRGLAVIRTKHHSEDSRASRIAFDRAWWAARLGNPNSLFADGEGEACKDSHSASVRRALLAHDDGDLPVIVKRPLARNWRRRISQLLPPSRGMRGWRIGHALLHRNLSAARPLAVVERRLGPLILDSLLITEAIPGTADLEAHLLAEHQARSPIEWFRHKRQLCEATARHLRRLEQRGFTHRDCKASNILVLEHAPDRLFWIDMDGLRHSGGRPPPLRQRLRALARLHVGLLRVPGLTRTDRVRFLRHYCVRWGGHGRDWRSLWRALVPLVDRKIRAGEARREWKRARYGRE